MATILKCACGKTFRPSLLQLSGAVTAVCPDCAPADGLNARDHETLDDISGTVTGGNPRESDEMPALRQSLENRFGSAAAEGAMGPRKPR